MKTRRQPQRPAQAARTKRFPKAVAAVALIVICTAAVILVLWYPRYAREQEDKDLRTKSIDELQSLAKDDPDNPRIKFYLGPLLMQKGRTDEALAVLAEAAKLAPDDGEIVAAYGYTESALGKDQDAVAQYEAFLKKHPGHPQVSYALANADLKQGKYKDAYDLAVGAARTHPKFEAEAWATAADAALRNSRKQEAVDALKTAVALDPSKPQYHLDLSSAYVALAMFPEAAASCREALKLSPNELPIHFALADVLLRGNTTDEQTREALTHLQTVLQAQQTLPQNGGLPRVYLLTGECYLRLRDWDQARTWLEKAALTDLYDYKSRYDLVKVYRHFGYTVEAEKTAQAAARLSAFERERDHYKLLITRSNDAAARLSLAKLYISAGLLHKAKGEYLEVLRADPNNQEATARIMALVERHPELKELTQEDLSDVPGPAPSP